MEFIEWGACYSGIYYDPRTKRYSTILSDLKDITFGCLDHARAWLDVYHGVAHTDNTELSDNIKKLENLGENNEGML